MATRLSRRLVARYVAKQLSDGDKDAATQVAAYLIDTGRTGEVDLLVRDIETALMDGGTVVADVVAMNKLSQSLQAEVVSYIKTQTAARDVQLRESVDADQLGGVKISLPGAEYDATLRRRIAKLKLMKV